MTVPRKARCSGPGESLILADKGACNESSRGVADTQDTSTMHASV